MASDWSYEVLFWIEINTHREKQRDRETKTDRQREATLCSYCSDGETEAYVRSESYQRASQPMSVRL